MLLEDLMRSPSISRFNEARAEALLERYPGAAPLSVIRARFMGEIASPRLRVRPLEALEAAWGGELPVFDDEAELQEILDTFVMSLWNALTEHTDRRHPFHLVRRDLPADPDGLERYCSERRAEIQAFVAGLYGPEEEIHLFPDARAKVEFLIGAAALLEELARVDVVRDDTARLRKAIRDAAEVSRRAERQINAVIRICTRARRGE